ncbi:hypothetical protein L9F63_022703, partial [Diploptera punctata]
EVFIENESDKKKIIVQENSKRTEGTKIRSSVWSVRGHTLQEDDKVVYIQPGGPSHPDFFLKLYKESLNCYAEKKIIKKTVLMPMYMKCLKFQNYEFPDNYHPLGFYELSFLRDNSLANTVAIFFFKRISQFQ